MRVTRLRVYPVKSLAGTDVESAEVNPWGLDQDRRWGLVDDRGAKITAREHNQLLGLSALALGDAVVRISDRAGAQIDVDARNGGETIAVDHAGQGTAIALGGDADAWLSVRLGLSARLVWQPDPTVRPIPSEDGGKPGDVVSLADSAPLLLASQSSMQQLDEWTGDDVSALDPVRFRPNVLIDGGEPFAEEAWTGVTIGDVRFRTTMICDRCVMTTIEPTTLVRGKEPIRSLAAHRRRDHKTWFGIRLTPEYPGRIAVADSVEPW